MKCEGMNCGIDKSVDPTAEHSRECLAQHAAAIAGGRFLPGGWTPIKDPLPQQRVDQAFEQYRHSEGVRSLQFAVVLKPAFEAGYAALYAEFCFLRGVCAGQERRLKELGEKDVFSVVATLDATQALELLDNPPEPVEILRQVIAFDPRPMGFFVWHTGGGYEAFRLELGDGAYLLITDRDGYLPDATSEEWVVGKYDGKQDEALGMATIAVPTSANELQVAIASLP